MVYEKYISSIDDQQAYLIFTGYLSRVGQVMETLTTRMQQEVDNE